MLRNENDRSPGVHTGALTDRASTTKVVGNRGSILLRGSMGSMRNNGSVENKGSSDIEQVTTKKQTISWASIVAKGIKQ